MMRTASLVSSVAMDYHGCAFCLIPIDFFGQEKTLKQESNDFRLGGEFITMFLMRGAQNASHSQYNATLRVKAHQ